MPFGVLFNFVYPFKQPMPEPPFELPYPLILVQVLGVSWGGRGLIGVVAYPRPPNQTQAQSKPGENHEDTQTRKIDFVLSSLVYGCAVCTVVSLSCEDSVSVQLIWYICLTSSRPFLEVGLGLLVGENRKSAGAATTPMKAMKAMKKG